MKSVEARQKETAEGQSAEGEHKLLKMREDDEGERRRNVKSKADPPVRRKLKMVYESSEDDSPLPCSRKHILVERRNIRSGKTEVAEYKF